MTTQLNGAEGRILVFACRWCALLGAERAGRERRSLPSGIRLVPVSCAGSVSPDLIVEAFANGAKGVAVLGCHLGGCRHNEANRDAHLRLTALGDLLETLGFGRERLLLSWGTAHEAAEYAGLMNRFAASLDRLAPLSFHAGAKPRCAGAPEAAAVGPAGSPAGTDSPDASPGSSGTGDHGTVSPASADHVKICCSGFCPDPETDANLRSLALEAVNGGRTVLGLALTGAGPIPSLFTKLGDLAAMTAGPKFPLAKTAARLLRDRQAGRIIGTDGADIALRDSALAILREPASSGASVPPDAQADVQSPLPLAVACRACDARALAVLAGMRQFAPDACTVLRIPCPVSQQKACGCENPAWPGEDAVSSATSSPATSPEVPASPGAPAVPSSPSAVPALWKELESCVGCRWCHDACPVCVCPECTLETASLPAGSGTPVPVAYHLVRAMHIADKCVCCGACADACPEGLPLMALHRVFAAKLKARTGFTAGDGPSPFGTARLAGGVLGAPSPEWLSVPELHGGEA